jgi:hypothetical protein
MSNLFGTNVTAFPGATTTITRKEWQDHCRDHEITFFLLGELRELRVKNIGGGVLKLSSRKWTEPREAGEPR